MILEHRINSVGKLGKYMLGADEAWKEAKHRAFLENGWFTPEFIELSCRNIGQNFLRTDLLQDWANYYKIAPGENHPKTVGIVMAGNIPLVGFHDLLSVYISGHKAVLKPSSKDEVLIKHLVDHLVTQEAANSDLVVFSERLNHCDAYIATGSSNTSRYFEYYFGKYPHIIRRNKTSVAILTGQETITDLENLADDVYQFFGLGCRNVTKIFVPAGYDFEPMLGAFRKYNYLAEHHKYRNNYDYNLAIHMLNNKYYMTNGSLLLIEDDSIFSPISQLNYEYYAANDDLVSSLQNNQQVQCLIGNGYVPFGQAQRPGLFDYADQVDTMDFLQGL